LLRSRARGHGGKQADREQQLCADACHGCSIITLL
jgi:hypothetical protein